MNIIQRALYRLLTKETKAFVARTTRLSEEHNLKHVVYHNTVETNDFSKVNPFSSAYAADQLKQIVNDALAAGGRGQSAAKRARDKIGEVFNITDVAQQDLLLHLGKRLLVLHGDAGFNSAAPVEA